MSSLDHLDPSILWRHFSHICSIPHTSRHEELLVAYIRDFADLHQLKWAIDKTGNICVTKNATKGNEQRQGVILQAHLDMVPQKNDCVRHNFISDPIVPYVEGSWVKAANTTLGADNGIGVATILAILESDAVAHGPLEALFTIDEETGMSGALGLERGFLKGKKLINLDTEDERELVIGCAGGLDCSARFTYAEDTIDSSVIAYSISLTGLKGGHSGIDISLGRGNAIKLLNRVLYKCAQECDFRISSIQGGSVRNAIPREANAIITIQSKDTSKLQELIFQQQTVLRSELYGAETGIELSIKPASLPIAVMSRDAQHTLLRAVYACPNGVIRMSSSVHDVVETSTNLAIINCNDGVATIHCLLRSAIQSAIKDLQSTIDSTLTLAGFNVSFTGGYPGWQPDPDSTLLKNMMDVYESVTGDIPEVKVIHAGLECGIIGAQYPGMEMVSCGPTIQFPHSPDERVSTDSVKRFWDYLVKVLTII